MELEYAIKGQDIYKKYKSFELNIPELLIPKGFATALIGENGAGKTTLLNILAGIRLDYKGRLEYFGSYDDKERENNPVVKEKIGYTGPGNYYLPQWKVQQVAKISGLLFENFHENRFEQLCDELSIGADSKDKKKKVSSLSDGNRMKLMIAGVLARDTELLIMDEPASPLDPLMRDRLCEIIREYLLEEEGQRSVFFSTHNISDMENVTDYAIIMANGKIAEAGFVEDLKEKYVMVKGENSDIECAKKVLYSISTNRYGYEGICLSEKLDQLAGCDISVETATLSQISVAIMKNFSRMK
ncbi:MAG: ABC transporter ATP-binding protein [Lachnospiraceae bacterium]|nr:ABC transporter ATP-binding protein [Lachnospiraceae bacterium]